MRGDRINYKGNISTPTAELPLVKIIAISIISAPKARGMCADLKDFYLGSPMHRYENMKIAIKDIPADIIEQYNLMELVYNGYVMVEIRQGMYSLPQAGKIAYDRLVKHLATAGYITCELTPG